MMLHTDMCNDFSLYSGYIPFVDAVEGLVCEGHHGRRFVFSFRATRQVLMPCSSILVCMAVLLSFLFFRYIDHSNMGIDVLARQRIGLEHS